MPRKKKGRVIYEDAPDIKEKALEIARIVGLNHIKPELLACLRSKNTSTDAIARCYGLSRIFQHAFKLSPRYVIEVISEKFDKLNEDEQIKILIHELLHIPKNFGGGFRGHDYVNGKTVDKLFRKYKELKNQINNFDGREKDI